MGRLRFRSLIALNDINPYVLVSAERAALNAARADAAEAGTKSN